MPFLSTIKSAVSAVNPKGRIAKEDLSGIDTPRSDDSISQRGNDYRTPFQPLREVNLPRVCIEHHFPLADQGWTKITFQEPSDKLQSYSQALFQASKEFFDLPADRKEVFKTREGSEEGWNYVEGEKEFITLRTLQNTPLELRPAASAFWAEAGGMLNEMLGRVAESLGLPARALEVFSEPCTQLTQEKTATMLRLFRYDGSVNEHMKTVAEAHRDLGLLSLVVGDTPGLEVWDRHTQTWFPIERCFDGAAGSVLVGRQLERLSNLRYRSGGHRVVSYPTQRAPEDAKPYRYSIVFVLRAHSPVVVNTDELTTEITGQHHNPLNGIEARDLFEAIRRSHFNINTNIAERNEQKQSLAAKKAQLLRESRPVLSPAAIEDPSASISAPLVT